MYFRIFKYLYYLMLYTSRFKYLNLFVEDYHITYFVVDPFQCGFIDLESEPRRKILPLINKQ